MIRRLIARLLGRRPSRSAELYSLHILSITPSDRMATMSAPPPLRAIPGMRHFAGSGPPGEFCGTCAHDHPRDWGRGQKVVCGLLEEIQRNPPPNSRYNPACKYWRAKNSPRTHATFE